MKVPAGLAALRHRRNFFMVAVAASMASVIGAWAGGSEIVWFGITGSLWLKIIITGFVILGDVYMTVQLVALAREIHRLREEPDEPDPLRPYR